MGSPKGGQIQPCCLRMNACMCAKLVVSDSATPWTVACQPSLCIGFSRQEHWSGLPCPPPRDIPDSGSEPKYPASPAWQADSYH